MLSTSDFPPISGCLATSIRNPSIAAMNAKNISVAQSIFDFSALVSSVLRAIRNPFTLHLLSFLSPAERMSPDPPPQHSAKSEGSLSLQEVLPLYQDWRQPLFLLPQEYHPQREISRIHVLQVFLRLHPGHLLLPGGNVS